MQIAIFSSPILAEENIFRYSYWLKSNHF